MYKLASEGVAVIRLKDGAYVPFSPGNTDYAEYLKWVEEGNTPEPAPEGPWREATWADYRSQRETYLDRLAGIATFDDAGDGVVKEACRVFRQRLLDLPSHPSVQEDVTPTLEDLELAIVTLYRTAVIEAATMAPAAKAAFSKINN